ncbi:MAG: sigma-54-dependent Fis family transcriptional regulator [Syntrophomonadaceae bacterium]
MSLRIVEATDTKQTNVWERFITSGKADFDVIRPEILESWQRCYKAKVNPYDGTSHLTLSEQELAQLRSKYAYLIEIARHFMEKLYTFVANSGFVILLSDDRGYILDSIGDYDIMNDASQVNLKVGTGWMEEEVGTNGIGTTLQLMKPIQVSSQEHYCKKLHPWTCSASPIFNDDHQIIGALQMSGPSNEVHTHTLGMVVAAAEAISYQIKVRKQNQQLTILNNSLQNIFQTMSDGAVIIDRQGTIIQVNPVAENILGNQLRGRPIEYLLGSALRTHKVLDKGQAYTNVEVRNNTETVNFHCLVTGKPIKDEKGNVTGALICFNPINKVKKLINQFSGAHATFHFEDIIGSEKLAVSVRMAKKAATKSSNVLIMGESGTGKELFAQAIHNSSMRRKGPFVALNCGAIPRELIASELFGYSEGAFTGARRGGRPGKFEMAAGGTLFLDEIGDMPLEEQVSLLRVLQERSIIRIGGDQVIPVNVRIICATNKNLKEEVAKGNFREDLYYRLNVISIVIPPLRERKEDIKLLFEHLLKKIARKVNTPIEYVQPEIIEYLQNYEWPGNVRELENVVERMIVNANGSALYLKHMPTEIVFRHDAPRKPLPQTAAAQPVNSGLNALITERNIILELLEQYNGNISRVAREMKLSRSTVYRKLDFYKITREYIVK